MLRIHEIRISNYLFFDSQPLTVTGTLIDETGARFILAENLKYYPLRSDRARPIPLSREWLSLLGFKYFRPDAYIFDGWKGSDRFDLWFENSLLSIRTRHHGQDQTQHLPHIRYVHHVQNLYLSLTNREILRPQTTNHHDTRTSFPSPQNRPAYK